MADCPLCHDKNIDYENRHLIYTVVEQTSKIHTGFKTDEYLTRITGAQKHLYKVCRKCEQKYTQIIPGIVWGIAGILSLIMLSLMKKGFALDAILFSAIPLLIAFSFNKQLFGINAQLKKLAIKERNESNLEQYKSQLNELHKGWSNPHRYLNVHALTEKEFEKTVAKGKVP